MDCEKALKLFRSRPVVINVGSPAFSKAIKNQDFKAVQVDWLPPAGGDRQMQKLLKIMGGLD